MEEFAAILQLKQGDMRGLEILVRKYQLIAVRIAFSITNDLGLAEEVVQEAFLRSYEHIRQFDETRPFRPWFLRIVVNDAIKLIRRHQKLIPLESEVQSSETTNWEYQKLCFEQAEFSNTHDNHTLLLETLQQLTPEHRAVLQLKYYLEMTDEEIAETMQIPPGTVKSRLHAAKSQIRALLTRLGLCPAR